jgi:hypothetical protein
VFTLNKIINDKDAKLQTFVEKILLKKLSDQPELLESIRKDIENEWPETKIPSKNTYSSPGILMANPDAILDISNKFSNTFYETFFTKEDELAKFKPNDE